MPKKGSQTAKPYALVALEAKKGFGTRTVIVPTSYIIRNENDYKTHVYYLPPPHNAEDTELIKDFVIKAPHPPPPNWEKFRCTLKKSANSYEEAFKMLESLKSKTKGQVVKVTKQNTKLSISKRKVKKSESTQPIALNGKVSMEPVSEQIKNDFHVPDLTEPMDDYSVQCLDLPNIKESNGELNYSNILEHSALLVDVKFYIQEGFEKIEQKLTGLMDQIIIPRLNILDTKITVLDNKVNALQSLSLKRKPLSEIQNYMTFSMFTELYSTYEFPLKTLSLFDDFNKNIEINARDMKSNLKKYFMYTLHPSKDIIDVFGSILKSFLSKTVVTAHVAQRPRKTNKSDPLSIKPPEMQPTPESSKPVFKHTAFYKCLEDSTLQVYNTALPDNKEPYTAKMLIKAIGSVINYARDWDGGRSARAHYTPGP